tara:strand:+ start:176 stop:763 length:588 start_codon:yes stop_codon:yes gene_type:complete
MEKRIISNSKFNTMNPKTDGNNTKLNILLFVLLAISGLYLYWFYFRDIINRTPRLPHAVNEDEDKLLNKEIDSPVIGMEPQTNQNIHELTDEEKQISGQDFYTVSDLMKTDVFFSNNPEIKIKDYNDNCKEAFDEMNPGEYINCLEKHKLIKKQNNMLNNEYRDINIYTNEKIMNGGSFMGDITGIEDGNYSAIM